VVDDAGGGESYEALRGLVCGLVGAGAQDRDQIAGPARIAGGHAKITKNGILAHDDAEK
jgi:hypothetical protein